MVLAAGIEVKSCSEDMTTHLFWLFLCGDSHVQLSFLSKSGLRYDRHLCEAESHRMQRFVTFKGSTWYAKEYQQKCHLAIGLFFDCKGGLGSAWSRLDS